MKVLANYLQHQEAMVDRHDVLALQSSKEMFRVVVTINCESLADNFNRNVLFNYTIKLLNTISSFIRIIIFNYLGCKFDLIGQSVTESSQSMTKQIFN